MARDCEPQKLLNRPKSKSASLILAVYFSSHCDLMVTSHTHRAKITHTITMLNVVAQKNAKVNSFFIKEGMVTKYGLKIVDELQKLLNRPKSMRASLILAVYCNQYPHCDLMTTWVRKVYQLHYHYAECCQAKNCNGSRLYKINEGPLIKILLLRNIRLLSKTLKPLIHY